MASKRTRLAVAGLIAATLLILPTTIFSTSNRTTVAAAYTASQKQTDGNVSNADCTTTGDTDGSWTSGLGAGLTVPDNAIPWVNKASESSGGIPKSYLAAMMQQESGFQPDVYAGDVNGGTWGLFQINRSEWVKYKPDATGTPPTGITNPMTHAEIGGKYLRDRLETVMTMQRTHPYAAYSQLTPLEALTIAHNAGEGNLQRYPNIPSITKTYLEHMRAWTGSDINWQPSGEPTAGASTSKCTSTTVTGTVEAGGAPTVTQSDFSWMCDSMHICKAGDYGIHSGVYGYQCVWYADVRLHMIHSGDWPWPGGDGGDVWKRAQTMSGFTVDQTPHPGDGVSATAAEAPKFAGTTHVAVVEEVQSDPSGWRIRISEGNMHQGATAQPCYYQGTKGCWNSYRGDRWLTKADIPGVHFFRYDTW